MKKIILTLLILLVAVSAASGSDISHVSVRNKNFEVVKVIKDQQSLQQFEKAWKEKKKIKNSPLTQWLYKIDIEGKGYGGRWLYDPTGYLQVLSKVKTPVYRISDAESFNKLIGAHNTPQEPVR